MELVQLITKFFEILPSNYLALKHVIKFQIFNIIKNKFNPCLLDNC